MSNLFDPLHVPLTGLPIPGLLGRAGIDYLLDVVGADYADDAAPVTSPIVGRSGELVVIDTGDLVSISSGQLVIATGGSASDPRLSENTGFARAAGLTDLTRWQKADTAQIVNGFDDGATGAVTGGQTIFGRGSEVLDMKIDGATITAPSEAFTKDVLYDTIWVLRNIGGFLFIKGGSEFIDWTLIWADVLGVDQTLYPALNNLAGECKYSLKRAAALADSTPEVGTRDLDLATPGTGPGTSSIAAPNAGDTGVMTPDALITFDVSAPTGDTEVFVRYIDATNYDAILIDSAGDLTYSEVVDGTPNNLITAAGVISGGEKISAVINDGDVDLFYVDTLAGTTSNATNNIAGIIFELDKEADAVTNLVARTLDGVANASSANFPGYGLATTVLPGPRAAADTFTHEADCVWEIILDALGAGAHRWFFRRQDVSNYWEILVSSIGTFQLNEIVAGAPTNRGNAIGVLAGGERITIIADDEEISGFYDNTLAWTYPSAANFKTETSGILNALGTTGEASDLISWPRDLTSAPNTPGAPKIKAAFDLMATP